MLRCHICVDNGQQFNRNDLLLLLPYIQHREKVINFISASKELMKTSHYQTFCLAFLLVGFSLLIPEPFQMRPTFQTHYIQQVQPKTRKLSLLTLILSAVNTVSDSSRQVKCNNKRSSRANKTTDTTDTTDDASLFAGLSSSLSDSSRGIFSYT